MPKRKTWWEETPDDPPAVRQDAEGEAVYDLNAAVRDILRQRRGDDESQEDLSKRFGIPQKTISLLMHNKGISLDTLSNLLSTIHENPIAFFASHPGLEQRRHLRATQTRLVDRFRASLGTAEQERLVAMLEEAKRLGIVAPVMHAIMSVLEAAKPPPATRLSETARQRRERQSKRT